MKRFWTRLLAALLMGSVASALSAAEQKQEATHPRTPLNVLFIVIDDLRAELGTYGVEEVKTPHIDALARRAVQFDRAYCQYPVCNPSRVSVLTGLRPDTSGVLNNNQHFRELLPDVVTLPQLFRQNGYFTASLGKIFHRGGTMEDVRREMDDPKSWDRAVYYQATGLGHQGEGRNLTGGRLEWCRWLAAEGTDLDQPDGQVAAEAMRLLRAKQNEPFFLAVGFHKPHDPFIAPKKYFELYPPGSLTLHRDPTDATPLPPLALPRGWQEEFRNFSDEKRLEFLRAYYAGISFVDAQVGKVLDTLDELGLRGQTIVVLWGDHGYHLGERDWWNKVTLFERSARVPLLVAAPGLGNEGTACQRLVELVDLYPTLTELAGLKSPDHLQGRSFVRLLRDPKGLSLPQVPQPWKEAAYTQVGRGRAKGYSVRTGRWRYTEWNNGKAGVELYDHQNDPGEWHNLAENPKYQQVIQHLSQLLEDYRK